MKAWLSAIPAVPLLAAEVVTSGAVRLMELPEQRWNYLKP